MIRKQGLDDQIHRIGSASAAFQKGLYHTLHLRKGAECDLFATVLRKYQSAFQLCLTHLLLDFTYSIHSQKIQSRLKKFCQDPRNPQGSEIDPAAVVSHNIFEERNNWPGHPPGSPLHDTSQLALGLISRLVEARHTLIYRPFFLQKEQLHWEDCDLLTFLGNTPTVDELVDAYEQFAVALLHHQGIEIAAREQLLEQIRHAPHQALELLSASGPNWADYFVQLQFWPYQDKRGDRPTETLLLTYARMLSPGDAQFIEELRNYRNQLFNLAETAPSLNIDPDWKVGKI